MKLKEFTNLSKNQFICILDRFINFGQQEAKIWDGSFNFIEDIRSGYHYKSLEQMQKALKSIESKGMKGYPAVGTLGEEIENGERYITCNFRSLIQGS